jgi:signal transduction histidine kinase
MHGLDVDLSAEHAVPLVDDDMRVLLFHIVRELLFNVVKHAKTDRALLQVEGESDQLVIRVSDGGRGFDVESMWAKSARGDRYGLSDIRSRLTLFQGRLEIESNDGGAGTHVTIYVPSDSLELSENDDEE